MSEPEVANFDRLFSVAYWIMKKKEKTWFYSAPPDQLVDVVIDEVLQKNKYLNILIDAHFFSFHKKVSEFIKEVKKDNQLKAFEVSSVLGRTRQERIIDEIRNAYPNAFKKKKKRTRKKYGVVQEKIEFPKRKRMTLLENPYFQDILKEEGTENPLIK